MARTTPVRKAWRSFTWLAVIIVGLVAVIGSGTIWGGASWLPKLALDLEGGTQIILEPVLDSGEDVSEEQLDQAVSIIRQRIDATGVSESEITTQGGRNVVVSIPGTPDDETMERIQASAQLEFRPVLLADLPTDSSMTDPSASPTPADEAAATPEPSLNSTPTVEPTDASDLNWVTEALADEFATVDCAELDETGVNAAPAAEPLVTCQDDGTVKYALGPVEVTGETIADASAGLIANAQGVTTNEWGVFIEFDGEGTEQFRSVTERLVGLTGVQNQFAIVLDGRVISAPTTNAVITDGRPQISGNFTQESAQTLADQLKYGALPLSFEVQSTNTISATLGTAQLQSGLIAGLIGMLLVFAYSLVQYRMLGLVTVASLAVSAGLAYLVIALLSWRQDYRLSLAGVAGLIVAIGIIADSFIVYFERIRDELRDGRSLESAVEIGWQRAFRTILASDTINLLAAVVLFVIAVGNVQGFAFTLGVTTIIDIVVVSLFTHPLMRLLARTRFFGGGHPLSGLNPQALGAVYRGRAQFRAPAAVPQRAGASREAARRQTIAERKAQEAAGVRQGEGKDS